MNQKIGTINNPKKILMLIPSVIKVGIESDIDNDLHPRMDYFALRDKLVERGDSVEIIDYTNLPQKLGSLRDLILSAIAAIRANEFDTIFCNSESIALPLGILLKGRRKRPKLIAIGHRISSPKKNAFFTTWNAMNGIDTIFLYSSYQKKYGEKILGIASKKIKLIPFHADDRFFRPDENKFKSNPPKGYEYQVCSAGLESRDYLSLIQAAKQLPNVHFHITASSPWSKDANKTQQTSIPENVKVGRLSFVELRQLYRDSDICVVPLNETDFQAGISSILEAMACGTPVIASKTKGQTDVIVDGVNGLYVQPGSYEDLITHINELLNNVSLREKIGHVSRDWVLENATMDNWVKYISDSM